jgi:hypothetical protein
MSDDLVKRLRSQLGDDVQYVKFFDFLFERAANRIEDLQSEVESFRTAAAVAGPALQKALREIEALTADNVLLRSIGTEMAESIEGNYYLPGVATRWRAALNPEKETK